jgi:hypothetical protein
MQQLLFIFLDHSLCCPHLNCSSDDDDVVQHTPSAEDNVFGLQLMRKWSWFISRYYSNIHLEQLRETMKILDQDTS